MAKTVLVTGASSGIGKATAIYLAQNGYNVYGAARRMEKMQELKDYGVKPIMLDVTKDESMVACVEKIVNEAGSIDVLINSYNQGIPSTEYIQAIVDCEYIVFSKTVLEELSMTIIGWDTIIAKITAKALAEKVNKISPMMTEDAAERYLRFLNKFPTLANRIPLSYVASYLGITQSSLSRIRKTIR